MAPNPLILDAQALKRLPVPNTAITQMPSGPLPVPASVLAAPNVSISPMTAPPPSLAAPPMPSVIKGPDQATQNTISRTIGDQAEYQRKLATGSGVSQIKNPFLRGLARIGDVAASVVAPGVAAAIPGTTNHHDFLLNQDMGRINNDLGNQQEQARIGQTDAMTNYLTQRPEIEQSKIDQKQTAVQQRVGQAAAARGQNVTWDEDGIPTFHDDINSEAYRDHQALSSMHQATADKNAIMADIAKNHYIPGTKEWDEAQRKLAQVDERRQIALGILGVRAQGLELRRENQKANLYGTDMNNNPIPGAPQLEDDEGNLQTVGLRAGNLAVKQQGKVTSFNDLQGSTQHARKAIEALHASGADLSDPNIVMAMSDPSTIAGKVINGKFVKANLTPQQVQAIGAINQLREQIGIMRATTGGPAAEAQAQRMLSALPEAGDSRSTAINKMDELSGVIDRLRPGAVHVAGGLKVTGQGTGNAMHGAPKTYTLTATGKDGHKIGSNDGGNTWFDVKTGKAVQ